MIVTEKFAQMVVEESLTNAELIAAEDYRLNFDEDAEKLDRLAAMMDVDYH